MVIYMSYIYGHTCISCNYFLCLQFEAEKVSFFYILTFLFKNVVELKYEF